MFEGFFFGREGGILLKTYIFKQVPGNAVDLWIIEKIKKTKATGIASTFHIREVLPIRTKKYIWKIGL